MEGFIIAAILVGWIAVLIVVGILAAERDGMSALGLWLFVFCWLVGGFGVIIQTHIEEGKSGPCVAYETQMHYNAATKTMMPAKVCVLRGEWVEEK